MIRIALSVNGLSLESEVEAGTLLLDLLRANGLTGAKEGCGVGVCGACTVLVGEDPVSSCLYLAACAQGSEVWTAEGVAEREPRLVRAILEVEALQCGICTPGQLVAAAALLGRHPEAGESEIRDFMSGNLCRCTGYGTIVEAIRAALAGD